jgi:hypothetical protein
MILPEPTINQLMAARHLYHLSKQNLESLQTIRLFAGVNLLHDAIEALIWAVAYYKGKARDRSEIMQLYEDVNATLSPAQLSFRPAVLQLNKVRISSKHYGICPDRKEALRLLTSITEFLKETTLTAFGANFMTVSLLDLLEDGEVKEILAIAQACFDNAEYLRCLVECRKAIFLLFENNYTIDRFKSGSVALNALALFSSRAPHYMKNANWIFENVKEPFDYIQIDHDVLDKELLTKGIEPQTFWNIWRGTPAVFRYSGTTEWLVRRELQKETQGTTEENASYILEETIDIALRLDESRRRTRAVGRGGRFFVRLKQDGVNIYHKADRESPVNGVTEVGLRELHVTEETVGLNDGGSYWKISHWTQDEETWYYGYIHNDDIDWTPHT